MKVCKFCGTQVDDAIQHCPSCGSNAFLHICENCGSHFESGFCPNCGVRAGQKKKICPECGSAYFSNACPNCGYTEIRKPIQQTVIHKHVYVQQKEQMPEPTPVQSEKHSGCLTVFLWIFFFPIMATIAILRSPNMKGLTKALLVLLVWGIIIGIGSTANKDSTKTSPTPTTSISRTTVKPAATNTRNPLPTATPDPIVVSAQKAIDEYFSSHSSAETTETPDPSTLSDTEKAQAKINSILSSINKAKTEARFASYKNGRGKVDTRGKEPDYLGVIGYAAVYENQRLDKNANFSQTPWKIPVYQKDKQFWKESGTIDHKTMVVVIEQQLEKMSNTGYNSRYKGYLHVIRLDTNESCYIDVTNFVTNQYWTGDLSTAIEKGYCIATFKQVSDYYPVAHGGGKAELEDGMMILLPASGTHYYSSPDKTNNPIPGIVFKEWKYGFGGVFVFFNTADLSVIY